MDYKNNKNPFLGRIIYMCFFSARHDEISDLIFVSGRIYHFNLEEWKEIKFTIQFFKIMRTK